MTGRMTGVREQRKGGLYTPQERARRDATVWTLVQGILAPVQFIVFLVSLFFVVRFLITGQGFEVAVGSIIIKTLILYTIMITGSIWEKVVFGQYLLAPPFFWEDMVSFLVLALHTAYLGALVFGWLSPTGQMVLALAAYAAYVINAAQFLLKLRAARKQGEREHAARTKASGDSLHNASGDASGLEFAR